MTEKTRNFDKEARTWDEKPERVMMAAQVAEAVKSEAELKSDMDILDFGCGTGLLTLELHLFVKTVTGADSSQGMLDILASKIENLGLRNVRIIFMENGNIDRLRGEYDLVVSSMTLHHVEDVSPLLRKFYEILKPGGMLCIADLDSDEGLFHSDNTGVFHYGFDRGELKSEFTKAGFADVNDRTAVKMTKSSSGGREREFSIFFISGRKG